ncbi:MAG: enoyl-CoA hydratase/isomerase family protein [Acidimicrobiales bacterium]|nr:enoyl-CoA hydratase/isomerase family protein [Acidimicrobiales bacterium]
MTDGELIRIERMEDGIGTLVLNRPEKKNALSIAVRDEISDALDALAVDDEVRVLVVTGAGDTFSAGFDLGEFADLSEEHQTRLWASSDRYHHTVMSFPLPVIAAVNGPALAGGFDLACLADVRLASTTARFAHPERDWGDVMYRPLRELVGGSIARDLVLTGRSIDAHEAHRLGLVSLVAEPDELAALALDWARRIATAPRDLLVRTKAKILDASVTSSGEHSTLEL